MTYNPPSRMYAPRRGRGYEHARAVCNKCIGRVDTRRLRLLEREDVPCSLCGETALILETVVRP